MRTAVCRVTTMGWAGCLFLAVTALGAATGAPTDEALRLQAQNGVLSQMIKLAKENAELKAQVQSLKQALDKAGIDWSAMSAVKPSPDQTKPAAVQPGQDPNAVVAEAIHNYAAAVKAITGSADLTDIQKRQAWLQASRRLDKVLRASEITIYYTISDVTVSVTKGGALLSLASAAIKTSDPTAPGPTWNMQGYDIVIQASEADASRITKKSGITIRGPACLNVDLSRPASEQPAVYDVRSHHRELPMILSEERLPGYLGTVGLLDRALGVRRQVWLMVKNDGFVEIDGVRRRVVWEAGSPPKETRSKPPRKRAVQPRKPPPPKPIRIYPPRIVR